ncbi:MAG TPA: type II toxin-antitoxin system RelE/ParE family toxin [Blastocatellia bacterium]|nr:type II toxin-antitoxin system RelE/ParE family toxin [Blastocatellia bacterium]
MASRTRPVVWTPLARRSLDEVVEYIAQDSPEAAEKVLENILGAAESLSRFSLRGRIVPEIDDTSVREVFIYKYRLIYEVTASDVRIIALLHGARDFDRSIREM